MAVASTLLLVDLRAHVYVRCGFVDEVSIRDGLVRVFFDRWDDDNVAESSPPSANAWRESAAVECNLFSAIIIGALILGAPASVVSRHMKAAGRALAKLAGWKEKPVVAALILFGLANALLPTPRDGSGDEQEKLHFSSMEDAQAIHGELPEKDPLVDAFLTFWATCEKITNFLPWRASVDAGNVSGWQDGGGGGGRDTRNLRVQASYPANVIAESEYAVAARREGIQESVTEDIPRANQLLC